jgi:hypothetical protein
MITAVHAIVRYRDNLYLKSDLKKNSTLALRSYFPTTNDDILRTIKK